MILQGYAVKRVPKMIRGITMAVIIAISTLGGICYLQVSKLFFDTAAYMIFVLVAIFDVPVLILILIASCAGAWGHLPINMQAEDGEAE